jgi:hypothetical protein
MTVQQYAGNKLTGLSTDTKPTTVPDGATFLETDTGQDYVKTSGTWVSVDVEKIRVTAGETLACYDIVYSDSADSGKYKKATNDGTEEQAEAYGIVIQTGGISNTELGYVVVSGRVTNTGWSLTPGDPIYLGTAGQVVQPKPASGKVKYLGYAESATAVYFDPGPQVQYTDKDTKIAVASLLAGGAQSGIEVTAEWGDFAETFSKVFDSDTSASGPYGIRQVLLASDISTAGSWIRLTVTAHSTNDSVYTHLCIAERSPDSPNAAGDFSGPKFKEILFSGTSGVTVPAGTSVLSDPLAFDIDPDKDYLITYGLPAATWYDRFVGSGGGGAYYKAGADDYNVETVSGYSFASGQSRVVSKIEVATSPTALNFDVPFASLLANGTQTGIEVTYAESGIPVEVWSETLDYAIGISQLGIRNVHDVSASGSQVRVTLISGPEGYGSLDLDHVCFARHDSGGSTVGTFGGATFKEFLFGGVTGVTIPAGDNEVTSDWLDFDVDEALEYLTIIGCQLGDDGNTYMPTNDTSRLVYWRNYPGCDDWNVQDISSLSYSTNARSFAVVKVEVRSSASPSLSFDAQTAGDLRYVQIGATGYEGPTGPQGVTGSQGSTGAQGPQGFQGIVGPTGPQGSLGVTGSQGNQGPQGTTGLLDSVLTVTAGEALSQYDVVSPDSTTGKWIKAQCDGTETEANAYGIVTQSGGIANDGTGSVTIMGKVTNSSWSWTKNGELYVSATPGQLTQTKPTTLGQYVRQVALAIDTTIVFIDPQLGWLLENAPMGPTGATGSQGAQGSVGVTGATGAQGATGAATTTRDLIVSIDGGGAAIAANTTVWFQVNYACTIQSWTLLADQSGSVTLDVWRDSYSNFPPTVADTITASAKPSISSATKNTSSTLTGWTTSVSAGDILKINVDSCTTIQRVVLILKVQTS